MTPQEYQALLYRQGISQIESGSFEGNYSAIGPKTRTGDRAYGRYQVMGNNVPSWTEKWYGKRLTPSEFHANPAAQDAVFDGEFGSYVNKYGEGPAAVKWFTGSPVAKGRSDGYTVDSDYQSRFVNNLGKLQKNPQPVQAVQNPQVVQGAQTQVAVNQGIASLPTVADVSTQAVPQPLPTSPTTPTQTAPASPFSGIFNAMLQSQMQVQQAHQQGVAMSEEPMMRGSDNRPVAERVASTSTTPNAYYDELMKRYS